MVNVVISTQGTCTDIRAVSPDPSVPYAGRKLAAVRQLPGGMYAVTVRPTVTRETTIVETWAGVLDLAERAA